MKKSFGQWLKDAIDLQGITQAEFAARINMQPSQVSRIISGERGTTIEVLELMGRALRLPPEDVFRAAIGLQQNTDGLTPKKRELIHLAEQSDDDAVDMALAVLETAWEKKKRK